MQKFEALQAKPIKYNWIVNIFRKKNGVFEMAEQTVPLSIAFVGIDHIKGSNFDVYPIKAVPNSGCSGELTQLLFFFDSFTPKNDVCKFEIQITDNANHKSNVVMTDEIILNKQ